MNTFFVFSYLKENGWLVMAEDRNDAILIVMTHLSNYTTEFADSLDVTELFKDKSIVDWRDL